MNKDAYDFIKLRQFTKYDHQLSYRELNHWSSQGLLFEQNEKGKWRRFNLIELIWIELVKELRQYEFSLKSIKSIKDSLSFNLSDNMIVDSVAVDQFKNMLKEMLSPEDYQMVLNSVQFKEIVESKSFSKLFQSELEGIPSIFELLVLEAYFLKIQFRVLVNYHGNIIFSNELFEQEVQQQVYFQENFSRSNISVSINSLLAKIFADYTAKDLNVKWKIISDEEEKLLESIRGEDIKSAKIRFNKDYKIDLIELRKKVDIDVHRHIQTLLVKGAYEEIKIVTQSGIVSHAEKTEKIKM